MHIFFDVDYTILGGDLSLRPGTREVRSTTRTLPTLSIVKGTAPY